MKLPALNAFLKCSSWLEKRDHEFPRHADLAEHLEAARLQLRWDLEALDAKEEEVASGWRQEALWAPRFNLAAEDHQLVVPAERKAPKRLAELGSGSYIVAWRNYLRSLLTPGFFFLLGASARAHLARPGEQAHAEPRGNR